ncbi:MAG TPA: tyrosine protein phosphatase [Xanthobacteraceae bacterium]|nr:tyrosine protein phosphatase [Xanthobacteraceae bacterium]
MIHVCSLARLHATVERTGARHVVTLLGDESTLQRPACVAPQDHLWLRLHDITAPTEGYIAPDVAHVEMLIEFVRSWDRSAPLVMHCYAGISRSTAAAFVAVCALNPQRDETAVAADLRRVSPTALPNPRIVSLADNLLERDGRMVSAIAAIGRGIPADEAEPFRLDLE